MSGTKQGIQASEVCQRLGGRDILNAVSIAVAPGAIVGLLGPSGAGKTTLVRIIAGAAKASAGEVRVQGHVMPSFEALGSIGYMAQSDALYPELSARQNLQFFGRLFGVTPLEERVHACAELVDLSSDLSRAVGQFSGGMRRRLSLAIALLHNPSVLLLDEPTVGIDPILRAAVWARFRELAEAGASILVTTHVMDEADKCDRVAMMRDGALIADASPAELKSMAGADSIEGAFLHFGAKA